MTRDCVSSGRIVAFSVVEERGSAGVLSTLLFPSTNHLYSVRAGSGLQFIGLLQRYDSADSQSASGDIKTGRQSATVATSISSPTVKLCLVSLGSYLRAVLSPLGLQ